MQLQSWIIASWPIIDQPCETAAKLTSALQHLGTTVSDDRDEFGRLLGHTIWGSTKLRLGVAWDWTEAHDGVFVLSDPMGVISNIGFVDETGASIPECTSAVQLNQIAHELPWQAEVAKAIRGNRTDGRWSMPARKAGTSTNDEGRWEASQQGMVGFDRGLRRL